MVSEKISEAINEQINKEFYSGYLYLSMSAYLKEIGLFGTSSWLRIQAKEEVEHGLKLFDYLIDSNKFITLKQIKTPDFEFHGVISIFEKILEHEKNITSSINAISKTAEIESDSATLTFVDWFIKEQSEEELIIKNIIKRLKLFGEDKTSLYLFDKDMGLRT